MNSSFSFLRARRLGRLAVASTVTTLALVCAGLLVAGRGVQTGGVPSDPAPPPLPELVATFSIVGYDPQTGDLGVAVQSKFFAVGRVVPFAAAGVGAVATQSYANTTYGPRGLQLLREGRSPEAVIEALLAEDPGRAQRQVGVINASGTAANFSGDECLAWAGGRSGPNYTAQGNILAGPEVVEAMATTFETAEGDLASRLVAALAAGQAAGGDARGRQSAALLVVREGAGYGGYDDRYIDLNVEDHETPIVELRRLLDIHHGRELGDRARRRLAAASSAVGEDARRILGDAIRLATRATELDPANGWLWMTLAESRLAAGDLDGASAAGVEALRRDPWIKTAVLEGISGSPRLVEALMEAAPFRRAWAEIGGT